MNTSFVYDKNKFSEADTVSGPHLLINNDMNKEWKSCRTIRISVRNSKINSSSWSPPCNRHYEPNDNRRSYSSRVENLTCHYCWLLSGKVRSLKGEHKIISIIFGRRTFFSIINHVFQGKREFYFIIMLFWKISYYLSRTRWALKLTSL